MSQSSLQLILASASPRRADLLREAGYLFEIDPANVDEEKFGAGLMPSDLARELSVAKAESVAERHSEAIVLAADTVVAFGDRSLGKPNDPNDARRMLTLL